MATPGPWPDVATARSFFNQLICHSPPKSEALSSFQNMEAVAAWLIERGIGPIVYHIFGQMSQPLADCLRADTFSALAENAMHFENLAQIVRCFERAGVPVVLLKGAALTHSAYAGIAWRTMVDVDMWLQPSEMSAAAACLRESGFVMAAGNDERPLRLQIISGGEFQFYRPDWAQGMVECHWSPFPGWWLRRTAAIDESAVWKRKVRMPAIGTQVYRLAAEDLLIQVAIHLAINHQFGPATIRGLLDVAMIMRSMSIEWSLVIERARRWRLKTAVWLVLNLASQIYGVSGLDKVLKQLAPSYWRRKLVTRIVSATSILAGNDHRHGLARFFLLLLLVDRPRDMARLVFRSLWPEDEWLQARYSQPKNHWQHIWHLLLRRRV